jgi:hypothetical protein
MTRTFLFALPLLFAIHSFMQSAQLKQALKRSLSSVGILVVLAFLVLVIMPIISSSNAELTNGVVSSVASSSASNGNPLGTRIANLALVAMTWNQAPWIGVATRAFLPDYVDSELILTFHRYGLIGLFALLSVYPAGILMAWKARRQHRELAAGIILMLIITCIYGVTQGVLINSRGGAIPYILLAILAASKRAGPVNHGFVKSKGPDSSVPSTPHAGTILPASESLW